MANGKRAYCIRSAPVRNRKLTGLLFYGNGSESTETTPMATGDRIRSNEMTSDAVARGRTTPRALLAVALLALAIAGCDIDKMLQSATDDALFGKPNADADIAGQWSFSSWYCCTTSGGDVTSASGSLFLGTGGGLSGSAALEGEAVIAFTGTLAGVWKSGANLGFSTGCAFEGTVRGSAGDYIRGTYRCSGENGTWAASRVAPPSSATQAASGRTQILSDR